MALAAAAGTAAMLRGSELTLLRAGAAVRKSVSFSTDLHLTFPEDSEMDLYAVRCIANALAFLGLTRSWVYTLPTDDATCVGNVQ